VRLRRVSFLRGQKKKKKRKRKRNLVEIRTKRRLKTEKMGGDLVRTKTRKRRKTKEEEGEEGEGDERSERSERKEKKSAQKSQDFSRRFESRY